MTAPVQAPPGANAYFGSMMATLHFWGYTSDLNVPSGVIGSFEMHTNEGAIVLDAIKGDKGDPGKDADIVHMQYEDDFTDPSQLPQNLENIDADIGKAWWIGNVVWMWSGSTYISKQMGTPGPVGPPPIIAAGAELVPSGQPDSLTQPIEVTPSASNSGLNVSLLFKFDHDSIMGPAGPSGPIRDAADFDNANGVLAGDVPVWNATTQKFEPTQLSLLGVEIYSVPSTYFTEASGAAVTGQQICAFPIPPRPFAWKPVVLSGHINVLGAELDPTNLFNIIQVGCQVLLGSPSAGVQIGRGWGTPLQRTTIESAYSTSGAPGAAVTPTNSLAYVPPNHTSPAQGTIYVVLANDGAVGAFSYNPAGSEMLIGVVPVPTQS
jgi:hypothetical protein